jgi:hypothetical protein
VLVILDGPGASVFLDKLATSDHEFDTWFRTKVDDIHPMDFSSSTRIVTMRADAHTAENRETSS